MKTLDKVIKGVEAYVKLFEEKGCFDCHYREDDCVKSCFLQDELYYLKEYKDLKSAMDWHKEMEEIRRSLTNDPLTWDELKTMEGKPVWIEYADDEEQTGWALIVKNPERPMFGKPKLFTFVRDEGKFYLTISGYGKRWQAYRKERS